MNEVSMATRCQELSDGLFTLIEGLTTVEVELDDHDVFYLGYTAGVLAKLAVALEKP
jgi:hypothetical protein